MARVQRTDGYAPISEYGVIGDGRTAALVARDGSVDWLCLPDVDSDAVFARILDAERGGCFELRPDEPFETERRYLPETNVLETTMRCAGGAVRVVDAMTLVGGEVAPLRQLVRRVEGLAGRVRLRFRVEPRFGYASKRTRLERRDGFGVASANPHAVGLRVWGGDWEVRDGAFVGDVEVAGG